MITSKKDLKKYIHRVEDEVAQVVVPAALYANVFTEEKAIEVLTELSSLTQEALDRVSIGYDKAPKAFDSAAAYKKARKAYFREAYDKIVADYEAAVNKLLAPVGK